MVIHPVKQVMLQDIAICCCCTEAATAIVTSKCRETVICSGPAHVIRTKNLMPTHQMSQMLRCHSQTGVNLAASRPA